MQSDYLFKMKDMKKILFALALFFTGSLYAQNGFVGCATGNEKVVAINTELEQEVLRLVNIERKKENLAPLEWSDELAYSARYHAKDMAFDNYFKHDSYDRKNGKLEVVCETFERVQIFFKSGFACAENISAGRSTAEATVEGWMNSPGHKANILDKSSKYLGVGYYMKEGSDWTHYCVQCFGY